MTESIIEAIEHNVKLFAETCDPDRDYQIAQCRKVLQRNLEIKAEKERDEQRLGMEWDPHQKAAVDDTIRRQRQRIQQREKALADRVERHRKQVQLVEEWFAAHSTHHPGGTFTAPHCTPEVVQQWAKETGRI